MEELYKEATNYLNWENLDFEKSYFICDACSSLLGSENFEAKGRDLLIRSIDASSIFHISVKPMLNDLVECAGLYPYLGDVDNEVSALRKEYHKSRYIDDVYLHSSQQQISELLEQSKSVVLSAPTSYGKTLLIHELVSSHRYRNIIIIQPTLALLDETRKSLSKYKDYKLIVSTRQEVNHKGGNIFLFTAERVLEFNDFPSIDFFAIDEFYKLSITRDDDRAIVLNQAFYKLLQFTKNYYLLGPVVTDLEDEFKSNLNFEWVKTDFATVAVNEHYVGEYKKNEEDKKKMDLYNLLVSLDEPTLIYCSSPNKTKELASDFIKFLLNQSLSYRSEQNSHVVEWCRINIHDSWSLNDFLLQSIGVHHGEMPRHLGSTLVDLFNNGDIQFLFCTATLIEGVNTSAKNVILYHRKKGPKKIDFFDFKNIAGRAGRMRKHFVGNVYKMDKEPDQLTFNVDVPIISQKNVPDDILMYMNQADLTQDSREQIKKYDEVDLELMTLVKKNSGMPIDGQISLVEAILANEDSLRGLLCWTGYPKYEQLSAVIDLAWTHLLRNTDTKGRVWSSKQLTFYTNLYFQSKSLGGFIAQLISKGNSPEDAISIALSTIRTWFQFKLPKLLITVSSLQEYIFKEEPGNYNYYATQIEHGFLPPNLSELIEYNIPTSLAKKFERFISEDDSIETIISKIKNVDWSRLGVIPYEELLLKRLIE
jgi:hypothetical protein